jgi:hypothetical protein
VSSTKADDFGIDSIQVKLMRADKHLAEALAVIDGYKRGECTITMEKDASIQMAVQRVRLSPAASPEISAIAGDFFSNVRSVLDYIVWQIVKSNPPNEPGANNQFATLFTSPIAALLHSEYHRGVI